jgi:uncharacterized protein (DUF885 family)
MRRISTATLVAALALCAGCGQRTETPPAQDAAAVQPQSAEPARLDPSAEFLAMTDRHASLSLRWTPEFATSLGVSEGVAGEDYHARLGGYGLAADERARALNEQFLSELLVVDGKKLKGTAALTYDVLKDAYQLGAQRNRFPFGVAAPFGSTTPYIVTPISGPQLFIPKMMLSQHPIDSKKNVEAYLARLADFGRVFDEAAAAMEADADLGYLPPRFALERAVETMREFTALPPASHPLATTLAAKLGGVKGLTEPERALYAERAAELVATAVYPAYARLASRLLALAQRSNDDAGVWRLGPEGEDYYRLSLKWFGAGDMTPEEVHALGLSEVARISAQMDEILRAEGLAEGTILQRLAQLAEREDMLYPDTDEGRKALLADLNAQAQAFLKIAAAAFETVPDADIEVRRIPVYEEDSAPAGFYMGPSRDGARPGIFWINLKTMSDWPKYILPSLTYHEAVPGHHFQIARQRDVADLPLIRNMFVYPEFSEGWALYAEGLAAEMGVYDGDALGELGRLRSELFRAARLVVDTGIHYKRWSREEAIDYMMATTGVPRGEAKLEVERYAVWPGQACAYKLGALRISALREKARSELGAAFDLRKFHEAVLSAGSMPLPVLEKRIDAWIADQRTA